MAYDWRQDLPALEDKYGIPPGLLGALVRAESGGNPSARSPVGAVGLTQLMPATARGLGVDPHDPRQNLEGGAKYLSAQLKKFKSVEKALAAYNAGPGAVQKYGGIPPYKETQTYVKRLKGYWKESSRYGQKKTGLQFTQPGKPSRHIQGGVRPITPVPVPKALPAPSRTITPGLEPERQAALSQAYDKDQDMAGLILDNRQRMQNAHDEVYGRKQLDYEMNQQAIAQAKLTNQQRILGPDKFIPGTVGTRVQPGGGSASYNPSSKFIKANGKWVRNVGQGEQPYQFLQRVGRAYGLRNDAGDYQTTGGKHSDGSFHYQGRAVDFGDAKNSRQQLFSFAEWARQNAKNIRELYYNPLGWGIKNGKVIKGLTVPGHDDHLHGAW